MTQSWRDTAWVPVRTQDGTPSLALRIGDQKGEWMHNPQGAWGETRFIYGGLLHRAQQKVQGQIKVLNMGLGLGYHELLVAQMCTERGQDFCLLTFEADGFLRETFRSCLELANQVGNFPQDPNSEIVQCYRDVFSCVSTQAWINLWRAFQEGRWVLRGSFPQDAFEEFRAHVIFWDPFSRKTHPELWDEEGLYSFFCSYGDDKNCWVTSYACNGPFRRALKRAGFQVFEEVGYAGKKKYLWGYRGPDSL